MRDKLELFAYLYRREILTPHGEANLRAELFGFLRALHTRGRVDSRGMVSVMRCLDGTLPTAARKFEHQCGVTETGSLPVVKVDLDGERTEGDGAISDQPLGRDSSPVVLGEADTSRTSGAGGMRARIVNDEDEGEETWGRGVKKVTGV